RHARGVPVPLGERGLLRRREEAQRGAADGAARAEAGGARRDRFGPGHRRAAHRRRRREPPAQPRSLDDRHHALPAPARLHRARQGPRAVGGTHRALGRTRARARTRAARLCVDRGRGGGRRRLADGRGRTGWRSGAMSDIDTWLATFRTQAASLSGAGLPWLGAIRQRAIERFADEGWPTNRIERYRHTSLAFLAQQRFAVAQGTSQATAPARAVIAQLRADGEAGHWLVFVDGAFAPALSEVGALPAGAQVGSLSDALARWPERVEAAFGSADAGDSPAALNAALATEGAFVRLARGVAVEAPIHLVFVATSPDVACHPRNLVVAEAGAQATLVEHYLAPPGGPAGAGSLTNAVTRIDA